MIIISEIGWSSNELILDNQVMYKILFIDIVLILNIIFYPSVLNVAYHIIYPNCVNIYRGIFNINHFVRVWYIN